MIDNFVAIFRISKWARLRQVLNLVRLRFNEFRAWPWNFTAKLFGSKTPSLLRSRANSLKKTLTSFLNLETEID